MRGCIRSLEMRPRFSASVGIKDLSLLPSILVGGPGRLHLNVYSLMTRSATSLRGNRQAPQFWGAPHHTQRLLPEGREGNATFTPDNSAFTAGCDRSIVSI